MEAELRIEPTLHKSHGPCPHCGGEEQTVWGWVHRGRGTRAVYYARWTAGRPADGMTWLLCVGPWGTGAADADRRSVGLRARIVKGRPQFMVIDAAQTPWGCEKAPVFGALLRRADVVDTALATEVYGYVDRILLEDPRVARFLATGEGMDGHGAPAHRDRAPTLRRPLRLAAHLIVVIAAGALWGTLAAAVADADWPVLGLVGLGVVVLVGPGLWRATRDARPRRVLQERHRRSQDGRGLRY